MSSARAAPSKFSLCRAIRGRELSAEWGLGEGSCILHAVPGFEGPGKAGSWQPVTASSLEGWEIHPAGGGVQRLGLTTGVEGLWNRQGR